MDHRKIDEAPRKNRNWPMNDNEECFSSSSSFFKVLIDLEKKKVNLVPNGQLRYSRMVKELSLYKYLLGGKRNYEHDRSNMPLPSLTTVQRELYRKTAPVEAFFDVEFLDEFIKSNNGGRYVWMCEDDTKITEGVSYNISRDTIVGLNLPMDESTGTPVIDFFKFTNIAAVKKFLIQYPLATYAKIVSVRPLKHNAKPFILAVYGCKGDDTAETVVKRWHYIRKILAERGITVVGEFKRLLMTFKVFHLVFINFFKPK